MVMARYLCFLVSHFLPYRVTIVMDTFFFLLNWSCGRLDTQRHQQPWKNSFHACSVTLYQAGFEPQRVFGTSFRSSFEGHILKAMLDFRAVVGKALL